MINPIKTELTRYHELFPAYKRFYYLSCGPYIYGTDKKWHHSFDEDFTARIIRSTSAAKEIRIDAILTAKNDGLEFGKVKTNMVACN